MRTTGKLSFHCELETAQWVALKMSGWQYLHEENGHVFEVECLAGYALDEARERYEREAVSVASVAKSFRGADFILSGFEYVAGKEIRWNHIITPNKAISENWAGEVSISGGVPRMSLEEKAAILAKENIDVKDALDMGATASIPLADLYRIFEIIRHNKSRDWIHKTVGKSETKRFTASLNHPKVLGSKRARHARLPGAPPSNPMNPGELRQYIRILLERWIVSLYSEHEER